MLNLLHIENVAVIERADIEFGPGLNVLTGETGAGKSIIIDSINAILGERTSKSIVRAGAASAIISAELTANNILPDWLEEHGIEAEDGGQLVIMRKLTADGKSSCRVNGFPVSTNQLRELGDRLIDVHGQNDGRRLLSESNHREYLDRFAGITSMLEAFKEKYDSYVSLKDKLEKLIGSEKDKELLSEKLSREISEIESAAPKKGEYERLVERGKLLNNAERITESIDNAYYAVYGNENSDGALSLISNAASELASAQRFSDTLDDILNDLNDLKYRTEDISDRLYGMRESLDFSPDELDRIESRLNTLSRLGKKYGSLDEIYKTLENAKNEFEDIEYISENIDKTKAELESCWNDIMTAGEEISAKRIEAGKKLENRIISELSELNMPGVRFHVEILPKSGNDGFDSTGCDVVRFLMSANAGEELGRISKIASGGELSRIMLAMKTVLSGSEDADTMIFDEIDTGVSGRAAQRVAEKLAEVSRGRQVLCVTHLPQLAVMADWQYLVEKGVENGRTFTKVTRLEKSQRCMEIARITGGTYITESLLQSASEQIEEADKFKSGLDN